MFIRSSRSRRVLRCEKGNESTPLHSFAVRDAPHRVRARGRLSTAMATFVSRVGVVRPTARATSPSRDGLRRLGPRSRIADGISVGCGWKQKRVGGARVGRTRLPADIRATTTDGEDLNEVKKRAAASSSAANKEAEEVAKKWGLEAGLWKVFSSKAEDGAVGGGGNKMDSAKKLLKVRAPTAHDSIRVRVAFARASRASAAARDGGDARRRSRRARSAGRRAPRDVATLPPKGVPRFFFGQGDRDRDRDRDGLTTHDRAPVLPVRPSSVAPPPPAPARRDTAARTSSRPSRCRSSRYPCATPSSARAWTWRRCSTAWGCTSPPRRRRRVRVSSHWSPYDRVGVVNFIIP